MTKAETVHWCPSCGQVEIDARHAQAVIVRSGDGTCKYHSEQWPRGTVRQCNEFFGDRCEPIPDRSLNQK